MADKNPNKIIEDLTEEEKVEEVEEEKPETETESETESKPEEGATKPETMTFDERIDSLAKDEQTAIDAYNAAIETFVDEPTVVEQLQKIKKEEEDHLAYLQKVKEDHSLVYTDTGGKEE